LKKKNAPNFALEQVGGEQMAVSVKTNLAFWPQHLPDSISKGQQKRALFQGEDRFLVGRRGAKKRANFDQGGVSTWETPKQTKTRPLVPSSVDKTKLAMV
jgi:hypothetical protein